MESSVFNNTVMDNVAQCSQDSIQGKTTKLSMFIQSTSNPLITNNVFKLAELHINFGIFVSQQTIKKKYFRHYLKSIYLFIHYFSQGTYDLFIPQAINKRVQQGNNYCEEHRIHFVLLFSGY